jgi:hypothetical protein
MVASAVLQKAKEEELVLRNAICESLLEDKLEGSKTINGPVHKLVVTAKLNRNVNKAVLEAIWDDLPEDQKACISYKPELKLGLYRAIESNGGLLMEAITVTPGQPSLSIQYIGE